MVPDNSNSEEEAKQKSLRWTPGNKNYPVYYFDSDTTGEKPYEEFYTETEILDLDSFKALGIIKNQEKIAISEVDQYLFGLKKLFGKENITKEEIIEFLKNCIPDFDHLDTGKNLDSKM